MFLSGSLLRSSTLQIELGFRTEAAAVAFEVSDETFRIRPVSEWRRIGEKESVVGEMKNSKILFTFVHSRVHDYELIMEIIHRYY
jgi:hypothetical protein